VKTGWFTEEGICLLSPQRLPFRHPGAEPLSYIAFNQLAVRRSSGAGKLRLVQIGFVGGPRSQQSGTENRGGYEVEEGDAGPHQSGGALLIGKD
jgi:hypothetical protein